MDKTQKAQQAYERVARNMVDGPLSMFFHEDPEYGRIYVAVGRKKGEVEIVDDQMRIRSREQQPWTGVWFVMVGDAPLGQQINALPYFWSEKQIMSDVVEQVKDPIGRFKDGGAFMEGWWRAGRS